MWISFLTLASITFVRCKGTIALSLFVDIKLTFVWRKCTFGKRKDSLLANESFFSNLEMTCYNV